MIEITTCGPCGVNLIRWDRGSHWANTQTGTFYCSETAHHRHQRDPDAGIVHVRPDAVAPMLIGVPWIDDVPIANAGYLGPRDVDEGIDLWPMDVGTFLNTQFPSPEDVTDPGLAATDVDPYRTRRPSYPPGDPGVTMDWGKLYDAVRSWPSDNPRCSMCGTAVVRGIKLGNASGAAPWVAQNGRPCLGGLTHRPGRLHRVPGQINYPDGEAPNGRCSGCGEPVWQRSDKLWTNRDGFLACAPSPAPETARHSPLPHRSQCRWCGQRLVTAGRDRDGHTWWQRDGLAAGEPQSSLGSCPMAPDDSLPHMPYAAVKATSPVNSHGHPTGGAGATLHMPGDRRYSITPAEALALIYDLAMTDEEIHRHAARMLVHQMIHGNGQTYPQWEDLLDALGVLDVIPKDLEPKLSKDGTVAQIWSGAVMLAEMLPEEILAHVQDMLTILSEIGKGASGDQS